MGFLTMGALSSYPWVGVIAGVGSILWAFWANVRRAQVLPERKRTLRAATVSHIGLCVVLQVSALYQYYSIGRQFFGVFSIIIILIISFWVVAYIYMVFPGGIVRHRD